jgi:hypothetical protein
MKEPKRSQILVKQILELNGAEFSCKSFPDSSGLLSELYKSGKIDRSPEQRVSDNNQKIWFYKANSNLKLKAEVKQKKQKVQKKSNKEIIFDLFLVKKTWSSLELIEKGFHRKSVRSSLRSLEVEGKIHVSGHLSTGARVPFNVYTLGKSPDNKIIEVKHKTKLNTDSSDVWKDVWPELFTLPKFKELGVKIHSHPY